MKSKTKAFAILFTGIALAIGVAVSSGIIRNSFKVDETHAATTYSATITSQVWSAYGSQTLTGVSWTAAATGGAYWGYDGTKGQQFGSGSSPAKPLTLSTSGISGTISSISIGTSGAKDVAATIGVTVGGSAYGGAAKSITASNATYTFTGSASGEIIFTWTQTSSKALYLKSISVDYSSKTLSSISVTGTPSKTSYYDGESFSSTGLTITANYSDSSSANVTADCTFTPNPLTTGTTSVTASYTEDGVTKTANISGLTVAARTLNSISVLTNPTKVSYKIGQSFDPAGMKIRAIYNVGANNDDYSAYSYSPTTAFDSLGSKTITITSTENVAISTSLSVTVADVTGGTYTVSLNTTVYTNPLNPSLLTINKSDVDLGDLVVDNINNVRLGSNPNPSHISIGGNSTTGGYFTITLPDGLIATSVKFSGLTVGTDATTPTLSINGGASFTYDGTIVETLKPYANALLISTLGTSRVWTSSIEITAVNSADASIDYGTHFLSSTAEECSALNVTSTTWSKLKATYDSADSSVKNLIKAADANAAGSDLEEALARYTNIVQKYGYEDYMGLGIVAGSNQFNIVNNNKGNIALIIIISILGISVLTSYRLVYIRKKD